MKQLQDHGIRLKNYNTGNHKTLCPNCSHTRKNKKDLCLSVTIESGGFIFNCHHCGFSGGSGRGNVVKKVYRKPELKKVNLHDSTIKWFGDRGISLATLEDMQITTAKRFMPQTGIEEVAIAFPFVRDNQIVNVKYRTKDKHFTQEKDCEKILYNLDGILGQDVVYWVEGEMDALTLIEAGIKNVVSVPDGAPNDYLDADSKKMDFVQNCADYLVDVKKHILAFDNDKNGKILTYEIASRLGKERCWTVDWGVCKDANEYALQNQNLAPLEAPKAFPLSGVEMISGEDRDSILDYLEHCKDGIFQTGWHSLDNLFKVRKGELTVVTGMPNHGKSEFVDCLITNLAQMHGQKFAICSLENPVIEHKVKICEKFLKSARWSNSNEFRAGLDIALEWASERFMFVRSDEEAVTIDWILGKARELVIRHGIFGLVIDPHNQIEHQRPNNMTEHEYIGDVLRKVRLFAKSYGVHVFYVAHPKKVPPGIAPNMYDISGSANWANMADNGIIIYRPTDDSGNKMHYTEIQIQKIRFQPIVGKVGVCKLEFLPHKAAFMDMQQ